MPHRLSAQRFFVLLYQRLDTRRAAVPGISDLQVLATLRGNIQPVQSVDVQAAADPLEAVALLLVHVDDLTFVCLAILARFDKNLWRLDEVEFLDFLLQLYRFREKRLALELLKVFEACSQIRLAGGIVFRSGILLSWKVSLSNTQIGYLAVDEGIHAIALRNASDSVGKDALYVFSVGFRVLNELQGQLRFSAPRKLLVQDIGIRLLQVLLDCDTLALQLEGMEGVPVL